MNELKRYGFMVLACVVYAIGLSFFIVPNSIVSGGISGLATLINYFIPKISVGTLLVILNAPIMLVSFKEQGVKFTLNAFLTIIVLGLITNFTEHIVRTYEIRLSDDVLMSCIYGGILEGIAIGLFCKYRVSSGGTELIGRFLHDWTKRLSIPLYSSILDGVIVILGAIFLKSIQNVFYALIVIFIVTKVSDLIIMGVNKSKLCYIISTNAKEIGTFLVHNSPRGVTLLDGVGMYSGNEKGVLLTCVKSSQITQLKEWIKKLDPNAFVIVSDTNEVLGNGFKDIIEKK